MSGWSCRIEVRYPDFSLIVTQAAGGSGYPGESLEIDARKYPARGSKYLGNFSDEGSSPSASTNGSD